MFQYFNNWNSHSDTYFPQSTVSLHLAMNKGLLLINCICKQDRKLRMCWFKKKYWCNHYKWVKVQLWSRIWLFHWFPLKSCHHFKKHMIPCSNCVTVIPTLIIPLLLYCVCLCSCAKGFAFFWLEFFSQPVLEFVVGLGSEMGRYLLTRLRRGCVNLSVLHTPT